jgi:type IV secretory pathway VirB10-like protein
MDQKRKIVIPLGEGFGKEAGGAKDFEGGSTVRAPLFDEEATMGARPVVPIAAAYPPPSTRFPLLALVVILAVSAGLAGGLAIGLYKSGQNRPSAASAPAETTTTASAEQASQTPAQEQLPATIASEKSPATQPRTVAAAAVEENAPTERAARDERPKRDEDKVSAPVAPRETAREKHDREESELEERTLARQEEREARRQQRQERRRRAREREEADSGDLNRQIDRGARELNRIREIFEGQHP